MWWKRPRFTIRSLMIVVGVAAVLSAIAVSINSQRLLTGTHLLLFGPALMLLVHRMLLVTLVRWEERKRESESPTRP